jgi:hypothetical protein
MMSETISLPVLVDDLGEGVVNGFWQNHVGNPRPWVRCRDESCEFPNRARDGDRTRQPGWGSFPRLVQKVAKLQRELRVTLPRALGGDLQCRSAKPLVIACDVALQQRLKLVGGCHDVLP